MSDYEDPQVRDALAMALGEKKIKVTSRAQRVRSLIIYALLVVGLVWVGTQQQNADRQGAQIVRACHDNQDNAQVLNDFVNKIVQAAKTNPGYSPAVRRERVESYEELHQKVPECPPLHGSQAHANDVPMWVWGTWVPRGPLTKGASFGDNPVFDWLRVLSVVLSMVLVGAIGRVLVESRRRPRPMHREQVARFGALVFLVPYVTFTELAVVGTPATPRLIAGLLGLILSIYGVWGIRRVQRNDPPPARR